MFGYVLTHPEVSSAVAAVAVGLHNAMVSPYQTSNTVPNLTPNRKINKTSYIPAPSYVIVHKSCILTQRSIAGPYFRRTCELAANMEYWRHGDSTTGLLFSSKKEK